MLKIFKQFSFIDSIELVAHTQVLGKLPEKFVLIQWFPQKVQGICFFRNGHIYCIAAGIELLSAVFSDIVER